MKHIALDTNVAIAILNGKRDVFDKITDVSAIYLPITVCGELLFGAKNAAKSRENMPIYQAFIATCLPLNINKVVAEEYANIRHELKIKGRPIPENDIWIAATCIAYNICLYTLDKHFIDITKLKTIS
ncbi:MAG: type II toxin-antitoxin system VapC family toxin [Chitinophagales bacterium]|nr:type II toxin-antitoxin system VapC family toxin [Chitinophagales bacterium]